MANKKSCKEVFDTYWEKSRDNIVKSFVNEIEFEKKLYLDTIKTLKEKQKRNIKHHQDCIRNYKKKLALKKTHLKKLEAICANMNGREQREYLKFITRTGDMREVEGIIARAENQPTEDKTIKTKIKGHKVNLIRDYYSMLKLGLRAGNCIRGYGYVVNEVFLDVEFERGLNWIYHIKFTERGIMLQQMAQYKIQKKSTKELDYHPETFISELLNSKEVLQLFEEWKKTPDVLTKKISELSQAQLTTAWANLAAHIAATLGNASPFQIRTTPGIFDQATPPESLSSSLTFEGDTEPSEGNDEE